MKALLFAMILAAYAQTFEVASIKTVTESEGRRRVASRGGPGTDDPELYRCENCTVTGLIVSGFGLEYYQIAGPDWMQSAHFDVSAKIAPGTTKAQFQMMIQNLLVERFKLTYHREQKERVAFNLVVAKNGPKLKPPLEKATGEWDPSSMKKDANGYPVLARGHGFTMAIDGDRAAMHFDSGDMAELAVRLSLQLGQTVTDATGLKGKYELNLSWVTGSSDDRPGPSIYEALQEQLGLKVESKKTMLEILTVDHLEKTPTGN